MWWRRRLEQWGKCNPVMLTVLSLVVGGVIAGPGGYAAAWAVWTSEEVTGLRRGLEQTGSEAVLDQVCLKKINEARDAGFNDAKKHICAVENFLQWYADQMEELAKRAEKLLHKPNAADQQVLNSEIAETIRQGEQFRSELLEIAGALDGEATRVQDLVLKGHPANEINAGIIGLQRYFAGKKIQMDGILQAMAPKVP